MTEPIEFDTRHLRLRQWCAADREPFAALNADPKVMEFFPALLSRAESDGMADRCQALIAERGWGFWAVETRTLHEFTGFVGLHIPAPELPFSPCVEVGWRLAAKHWGKGFATEAARGALRVGFEQLGLLEIVSFAAADNFRSRAVMERLGMLETRETFEHPTIPVGHVLRKHCLYRLSRGQWLTNKHFEWDAQWTASPLS
ncbi:MAG: GNAT family N-acetyltransferase [Hydrogenophilales bacterium 17-64-11]|nr:MAG: GNAT family N-acetyltransferase [Hydrogenophilales bacterium 17-64-11]